MSNKSVVLIELDALLDTRLGTLSSMNAEAPIKVMENEYHDRVIDDFNYLTGGLIDNDDYKDRYYDRNVETLKDSRLTNIVKLLYALTECGDNLSLNSPDVKSLAVEINVWPYKLDAEELELLVLAVSNYTFAGTEVNVVNVPHSELTVSRIKSTWDTVIIYDFDRWFSNHGDGLTKIPIPRTLMYCPALYSKLPDRETLQSNQNPFTVLEMAMVEKLNIEFLPAKEFSILI